METNKFKFCKSCGKKIKTSARFCSGCGRECSSHTDLQADKKVMKCLECGANLKPEAKFCRKCGAPINNVTKVYSRKQPYKYKYKWKPSSKLIGSKFLGISACAIIVLTFIGFYISGNFTGIFEKVGLKQTNHMKLGSIEGDFEPGRTLLINGEGLGQYDSKTCVVTISGEKAQIYSWGENLISVLVPVDLKSGKHEISVTGTLGKKKINQVFTAPNVTVAAEGFISKDKENVIDGGGFKLTVPATSVLKEQKLVIKKLISQNIKSDGLLENIMEYEVSSDEDSHVQFNGPVTLSIDLSKSDLKLSGINSNPQLSAYTYDEWQGRWFLQESSYDKDKNILNINTDHFCPGNVKVAKNEAKTIESKYCKVNYVTNEQAKGTNVPNPAYPDSNTVALEVAKMFDKSYEAYLNVMGRENSPDYTKTATGDKRAIIQVTANADKSGASQRSLSGELVLPVSYDSVEEMEIMVAHELFHSFQALQYGNLKKLLSAGKQKDVADWTLTKSSFTNYIVNSGFIMDATAEYAANAIARGQKISLAYYDDTKIGKPFYKFEQKNSKSHEYGMSAFVQYIVDKNVFSGTVSKEEAFKNFWMSFAKESGYSLNVVPALDKVVNNMIGEKNAQEAYEKFWIAVLTDSAAANFSNNNGIDSVNYPTYTDDLTISGENGGYAANTIVLQQREYAKKFPTIKVQSIWFKMPSERSLFTDIYMMSGNASDNMRTFNKLEKIAAFDYVSDGKKSIYKPLTYDVTKSNYVIRLFTSDSNLKQFDNKLKILASNVELTNEQELVKYYSSNYTLREEKEFKFKLDGFHEQYKGAEALEVQINWGDSEENQKIKDVDANTEFKVKHAYSPDAISNGTPKITIYVRDVKGNLLHQYEKNINSIRVRFDSSLYTGQPDQDIEFSASVSYKPKNSKYVWNFGDNEKSETNTAYISHRYKKDGKYSASLELYDLDSKDSKPIATAQTSVEVTKADSGWIGIWASNETYNNRRFGYSIRPSDIEGYEYKIFIVSILSDGSKITNNYTYYLGHLVNNNELEMYSYYGGQVDKSTKVLLKKDKNAIYDDKTSYYFVK